MACWMDACTHRRLRWRALTDMMIDASNWHAAGHRALMHATVLAVDHRLDCNYKNRGCHNPWNTYLPNQPATTTKQQSSNHPRTDSHPRPKHPIANAYEPHFNAWLV